MFKSFIRPSLKLTDQISQFNSNLQQIMSFKTNKFAAQICWSLNSSKIFTTQYNDWAINVWNYWAEFLLFNPFILILLKCAFDIIQRDSCISVNISQFYLFLALASVACNRLSKVVLGRLNGPVFLHIYLVHCVKLLWSNKLTRRSVAVSYVQLTIFFIQT